MIISPDGLILTNAHVLEAGQAQQQQTPFGGEGGTAGQPQGLTAVFQKGNRAPVQVVGTEFDLAWEPQGGGLTLSMSKGEVKLSEANGKHRTLRAGESLHLPVSLSSP